MRNHPNAVTLNPYFKIHPGQVEAVRASLGAFVERTASEPACIFYGFTMNGDELFCQEAYESGEGVLAHLGNVGDLLGKLLEKAKLIRLEVHGPAAELDKLRGALADMKPAWFVWQTGL